MISFVNTKTKTVAIPQEADVWHRNRVHKAMKSIFGEYNMERLNSKNSHTSDIVLMDFPKLHKVFFAMEISAKPPQWTWREFYDIVGLSQMAPLYSGGIDKIKFLEV